MEEYQWHELPDQNAEPAHPDLLRLVLGARHRVEPGGPHQDCAPQRGGQRTRRALERAGSPQLRANLGDVRGRQPDRSLCMDQEDQRRRQRPPVRLLPAVQRPGRHLRLLCGLLSASLGPVHDVLHLRRPVQSHRQVPRGHGDGARHGEGRAGDDERDHGARAHRLRRQRGAPLELHGRCVHARHAASFQLRRPRGGGGRVGRGRERRQVLGHAQLLGRVLGGNGVGSRGAWARHAQTRVVVRLGRRGLHQHQLSVL
mmetsp:Transcript_31323/g.62566  ORF Transcript_31323/g.62566 Transcript_31323/m.62566 type:complete len:257 (-) Transcript_31323:371-1141(-)